MLYRLIIIILSLIFLIGITTQAADWTTDVQISNRAGVYDVELIKDPTTGNLFAALAWGTYGWSTSVSTDDGATWTETYLRSTGIILKDVTLAVNGNYFYLGVATPLGVRLYRFNIYSGTQVSWPGREYVAVVSEDFEEIELASPTNLPSDVMHLVAHNGHDRLYHAVSYYAMDSWTGSYENNYEVTRGLSIDVVQWPTMGVPTSELYISYYSTIDAPTVDRLVYPGGLWTELFSGIGGDLASETDISVVGVPGWGGWVYLVYELAGSSRMLVVAWLDDGSASWSSELMESVASLMTPAMTASVKGGVGLAYTKSQGTTIVLVQGKYEQTDWNYFVSPTDGPSEKFSDYIPEFGVQPSIIQTCGNGHGILYASFYGSNYAYYTRRTIYCGEYTAGYSGNADCSIDGKRNLADITRLIDRVYISKEPLTIEAEGNTDGDDLGKVNLADITLLIDHVYISKAETAVCR